jgi:hypothetical protein
VLGTQTQHLDVPARTDISYSQMFPIFGREGSFSARVRLRY